jgi:hypothetical protein
MDVLAQARGGEGALADQLDGAESDRPVGPASGEEVGRGPFGRPVGPEHVQQARGEHDVAVLASLALADADDHAGAVDVLEAEVGDLGEPQAGGIGGH